MIIMSTKITRLTANNIDALQAAMNEAGLTGVTLTATTATFEGTPAEALHRLDAAKTALVVLHGGKGHPVASIHAARRKLLAAVDADVKATPVADEQPEITTDDVEQLTRRCRCCAKVLPISDPDVCERCDAEETNEQPRELTATELDALPADQVDTYKQPPAGLVSKLSFLTEQPKAKPQRPLSGAQLDALKSLADVERQIRNPYYPTQRTYDALSGRGLVEMGPRGAYVLTDAGREAIYPYAQLTCTRLLTADELRERDRDVPERDDYRAAPSAAWRCGRPTWVAVRGIEGYTWRVRVNTPLCEECCRSQPRDDGPRGD